MTSGTFAEYIGDIVSSTHTESAPPFITPQLLAWILLLITLLLITVGAQWWKWVLLGLQFLMGLLLLYVALFTQQFAGAGWLMMVLFNPLSLILWKWHKYWQLPYAVLLLIEALVLVCWPHMLVDPAYIVLLLSYSVLFASEPIKHAYVLYKKKK